MNITFQNIGAILNTTEVRQVLVIIIILNLLEIKPIFCMLKLLNIHLTKTVAAYGPLVLEPAEGLQTPYCDTIQFSVNLFSNQIH